MKKILFFILTVFTFDISNAQFLSIAIELSPDSALTGFDFTCSQVIDGRYNKNNIGQIYRDRKKIEIHFINEFTEHLKSSTDKLLPHSTEKIPLVLIFKELSVFEKIDISHKYGTCNVKIEIAKQVDLSLYSLGIFSSTITATKGNIQYTHGKRVIESITECLKKFDKTKWRSNKGILIKKGKSNYKFDYKNIPPKGIYLSYNQLSMKSPIDSLKFTINLNNKSIHFPAYKLDMDNIFIKEQAQFISDGKNLYMRSNQFQFVKATSFGKYIYFQGRVPIKSKADNKIATAAIIGGLTGVMIFAATSSKSTNSKGKGIVLETETGILKLVTDLYLLKITKPFPLMLQTYRKSRRKLDDKRDVIFKLNSMFK